MHSQSCRPSRNERRKRSPKREIQNTVKYRPLAILAVRNLPVRTFQDLLRKLFDLGTTVPRLGIGVEAPFDDFVARYRYRQRCGKNFLAAREFSEQGTRKEGKTQVCVSFPLWGCVHPQTASVLGGTTDCPRLRARTYIPVERAFVYNLSCTTT